MSSTRARERMSRRSPSLGSSFCWLIWLALWLGTTSSAWAKAPESWSVGPAPKWVQPIPDPQDPEFATAHPTGGLAYEILESQRRIVDGEDWYYVRVVVRVVSEAGAEAAGQQTFEFSPPNERLVLHSIHVHRGDETFSRLHAKDVQLLQREANLDRLIYDNRRTAFVLIPDLRVGDVLEYDFSIVGANPVLEGHVGLGISASRSVAVGATSTRILVDHPLQARSFGGAATPTPERVGRLYAYNFRADSVPADPQVENVPAEEQLVGWVQLTDFEDWKSVAQWGINLFEPAAYTSPAVDAVLEELDVSARPKEAQILAVLQWVQSEIRYFSLPFAESTHRPTPPATVLERRYGDCKDKALLTVVMLRELGIDAQVALVDSDGGRFVPQMLPSAFAFDHAIVVTFPQGTPVWLDPTASYQRGSLRDVAARGFHWALPLAHDVRRLVPVEEPPRTEPDAVVRAHYMSIGFDDPVTLDVEARYSGAWAETFRFFHDTRDEAAFAQIFEEGLEAELRKVYPKAESTGPLEFEDEAAGNHVVLRRSYDLPDFWIEEGGQPQTTVQPFNLFGSADTPEVGRSVPFALTFPKHVQHHAKLSMHQEFAFDREELRIDDGPLLFEFAAASNRKTVELSWTLANRRHRVEADELAAYDATLDRVNEHMSFSLWETLPAISEEGTFNWPMAVAGGLWVLILAGAGIWILARAPYLRRDHIHYDPSLSGLGGWLALLGFGLVVTLPRLLYDLYGQLPAYSNESWTALTSPDSPVYHPLWAPVLLGELFANLFLLVLAVVLVVAYFKKHRSFPVLYIAMHVVSTLVITGDELLLSVMPTDDSTAVREIVIQWIRSIVWVLYILRSVRVRSTFLPRPDNLPEDPMRFRPR